MASVSVSERISLWQLRLSSLSESRQVLIQASAIGHALMQQDASWQQSLRSCYARLRRVDDALSLISKEVQDAMQGQEKKEGQA